MGKKESKKSGFNIAAAFAAITGAGLNVFIPIAFFVFLAKILTVKFSFSEKIIPWAVAIGALSGFYNMIRYIYMQINKKG